MTINVAKSQQGMVSHHSASTVLLLHPKIAVTLQELKFRLKMTVVQVEKAFCSCREEEQFAFLTDLLACEFEARESQW